MDLIILAMTLLFSVVLAFAVGRAFLDLVFFFLLRGLNPIDHAAAHAPGDLKRREATTPGLLAQSSS
jgi:hypothetical protein